MGGIDYIDHNIWPLIDNEVPGDGFIYCPGTKGIDPGDRL